MPTYAIGDVQGCYDELRRLLDKLNFDATRDTLWFVGDLVNRGPKSLQVLRFVKSLGERAIAVQGNHDLHTLAIAHGHSKLKRSDTVAELLGAEDSGELLEWLRHLPLLHHDQQSGYTMLHAGLPPQWNLADAQARAAEVEAVLRGDDFSEFLFHMYGDEPMRWTEDLQGWERLRFITNCFTRLRYCDTLGRLALQEKGPPGTQPHELLPWFDVPHRASRDMKIIFGHWSTLGESGDPNAIGLDSGCLWGGSLTALCLESGAFTRLDCPGWRKPGKE